MTLLLPRATHILSAHPVRDAKRAATESLQQHPLPFATPIARSFCEGCV